MTGAELAACAKNAAALASAAAAVAAAPTSPARPPGRSSPRCTSWRCASGGRSETFAGLAGAGDLVATAIAEGSRNRRAGELVGARHAAPVQVEATVQQTAEALATVPLLGARARAARASTPRSRPACAGCSTASSSPEQWLESVRSATPKRRTPRRLTARAE